MLQSFSQTYYTSSKPSKENSNKGINHYTLKVFFIHFGKFSNSNELPELNFSQNI